jgi:hypothetical protein
MFSVSQNAHYATEVEKTFNHILEVKLDDRDIIGEINRICYTALLTRFLFYHQKMQNCKHFQNNQPKLHQN